MFLLRIFDTSFASEIIPDIQCTSNVRIWMIIYDIMMMSSSIIISAVLDLGLSVCDVLCDAAPAPTDALAIRRSDRSEQARKKINGQRDWPAL